MNPSIADTGNIIEKAEHFGERFGFPAIVTIIIVIGVMFGLSRLLTFYINDNKTKLDSISVNMEKMNAQHQSILTAMDKSSMIMCATCWNTANSQEEIKRCSCTFK